MRSAWVYDGLGSWGDDPGEGAALGVEGSECSDDNVCCPGGGAGCDFRCAPVLVDSAEPDGSAVEHRCALLDYAWCTHRHVDRSLHAGGEFVYLDRCNGYEGPNGYAYPPKCMQGQKMCCGDAICGGPETADNCPEDC